MDTLGVISLMCRLITDLKWLIDQFWGLHFLTVGGLGSALVHRGREDLLVHSDLWEDLGLTYVFLNVLCLV